MDDAEQFEDEAGIFTWCLGEDRLYGDTTIAAIFGFDPRQTLRGLPMCDYVDRIHPSDRGDVAALMSKAVRDGSPYRAEYRVANSEGEPIWVVTFGRCFRDQSGNPNYYSGIIHPADGLLEDG